MHLLSRYSLVHSDLVQAYRFALTPFPVRWVWRRPSLTGPLLTLTRGRLGVSWRNVERQGENLKILTWPSLACPVFLQLPVPPKIYMPTPRLREAQEGVRPRSGPFQIMRGTRAIPAASPKREGGNGGGGGGGRNAKRREEDERAKGRSDQLLDPARLFVCSPSL